MKIDLLPGEHMVMTVRKHWFIFFVETIVVCIAALLPFLVRGFAHTALVRQGIVADLLEKEDLVLFFSFAWLILFIMILFVIFTNYYLDMLVITNQRLIDVDQKALFVRDVVTIPLHNIQDVKIEVLGILATLFKFGNLQIQSAAETKEIVVRGIWHPESAKEIIIRLYEQAVEHRTIKP